VSQAGIINVAGGGGGGAPIQTLTGNSGGPVAPTANNINVVGGSSIVNDANGITVIGNPGTSTETFTLTNRPQGQVTTSDATPTNIITFAAGAVAGTYAITGQVDAYDLTDVAGAAYFFTAGIRTTGAATVLIGAQFSTEFEEAAMVPSDIDILVSGNNILVQVVGIAGKTIHWDAIFTYRFVS
jgi:hypothetical protein